MSTRIRQPKAVPLGEWAEYGFVVQWCDNKPAALAEALVASYYEEADETGEVGVSPSPIDRSAQVDFTALEPAWYRWTPCHTSSCYDGGGHSGHLQRVDQPGRSIWRGVEVVR